MLPLSKANGHGPDARPRSILVIAHPGHELRISGWLETALPDVWVLTDGSGRTGQSRIDSTTRVLKSTGAAPGVVYGQMTDADVYTAIRSFHHGPFIHLVDQLAAALIRDDIQCVVGDAEEGYNPTHDACRLIINAAIKLVERKTNRQIPNSDFTLSGPPGRRQDEVSAGALLLNLDDAAFARKLSAARNYPALQAEVEAALHGAGHEPFREHSDLVTRAQSNYGAAEANQFRVEYLRPCTNTSSMPPFDDIPFYE